MVRREIVCDGCFQNVELHAKSMCYKCYKRQYKPRTIICKSCKRTRPHHSFGLCAGCNTRLNHYDKVKAYNVKKYYGITLEKFMEFTKICLSCGFKKIVDLHHLDGNSKNSDSSNLIGLCPNCHKMMHTYKYHKIIAERLKKKGLDVSHLHPTNFVKN